MLRCNETNKGVDMAKTNAERQQQYRQNRVFAGPDRNGERRLNTWLSTGAKLALERLAARYGVTEKEVLEKLVFEADDKVFSTLEFDSADFVAYLNASPAIMPVVTR